MAQIKVRSFIKVNPVVSSKGDGSVAGLLAVVKGINRMGFVVESIGKNAETVDKISKFRSEFLVQTSAKKIKAETAQQRKDAATEKALEQNQKRWWRRFLDQKTEDATEKAAKDPDKVIDKKSDIVKKALSPLGKMFKTLNAILEPIMRMFVLLPIMNWITGQDTGKLASFLKNIFIIFNFVRKLTGFGIGAMLDGLTNLFGGFDKIRKGNIFGALQGLFGVVQLFTGIALLKAAQYIIMPWKLINDVKWITKLFTDLGKAGGEAEGISKNKDITGYVDKNGNIISKEDLDKAKSKSAKRDEKTGKKAGKGWSYSGGQDYLSDRYRAQYGKKKKGFLSKTAQRTRIGMNRATKGVRGQFNMASNWMEANPAKANGIFSVVGGITRTAGGLMSGENAGNAVGAGVGQATGGIAGFALGNMLLPGVGGIIGSMLGSFLGEWVGTKLGPIIDPIMKPLGNAFKLGFDIIGMGISPLMESFGEGFSAIIDVLAEIINLSTWLLSGATDLIKFGWDNSLTKKALDGLFWVWQNKDNIGNAVKDVLGNVAKGTADYLTFNLFDFDKQNKAIGGRVPLMAAGGILPTENSDVTGLKMAGSSIISATLGSLDRLGIVGQMTAMAIMPSAMAFSNLFGSKRTGISGDRLSAQISKPSGSGNSTNGLQNSSNDPLVDIVGTGPVKLISTQPTGAYKSMNDNSMRGTLADILNAVVSLKFSDGTDSGGVIPGSGGGGGGSDPTVGPIAPGPTHQKGANIAKQLMSLIGIKDYQAAAIVGNIIQESSLVPNRVQGSGMRTGPLKLDGTTGYSYPQWTDLGRQRNFASYMESKGFDWKTKGATDELATGFLAKEFKSYMSNVFTSTKNVAAASNWVLFNYEKPADKGTREQQERATDAASVLAKMAIGGILNDKNAAVKKFTVGRSLDKKGNLVRSTAPGKSSGGIVQSAKKAVAQGKQGPEKPPCASWVRMVLGMAGHPAQHKVTSKGDLDPEKKAWGPNMAASFAGSDMGAVIRGQSALEPGDIVLHQNTFGPYPPGAVTHVSIASDKKGKILHQSTTGGAPKEGGMFKFKAGVRLGGSGSISGDGSGDGSSPTGSSSSGGGGGSSSLLQGEGKPADPMEALNEALKKWSEAFGGTSEVSSNTKNSPPSPTPAAISPSPTPTSSASKVQTQSESFTSTEATKVGGSAVVPLVMPVGGGGGSSPTPRFVMNRPISTALLNG